MNACDRQTIIRRRVGANIKQVRVDQGISQEQLGMLVDHDRSVISRIEHGLLNVPLDTFVLIASALDVPTATLLDGVEEPRRGGGASLHFGIPRRDS